MGITMVGRTVKNLMRGDNVKKYLKRMAAMVVFVVALVSIVGMATNSSDNLFLRENMVIVERVGELGFVGTKGSGNGFSPVY